MIFNDSLSFCSLEIMCYGVKDIFTKLEIHKGVPYFLNQYIISLLLKSGFLHGPIQIYVLPEKI